MISLLNDYLKDMCDMKDYYTFHCDIAEKDELLSPLRKVFFGENLSKHLLIFNEL